MLACGSYFTFALMNGRVVSFGDNAHGALGRLITNSSIGDNFFPMNIDAGALIRQVSCGSAHTALVTFEGDLFMCGSGTYGRLGLGDDKDRATPTLVPRNMFDGKAVLMVACGVHHTAVATEDGGVFTFGNELRRRLEFGNKQVQLEPEKVSAAAFNDERIVMVAAGNGHTVALSEAGHVFTWGRGNIGQLGHNDRKDNRVPRQVEPGRFGNEKVVFVAAGRSHTAAVTTRGRLYTWGFNSGGQLGHGDTDHKLVPTLVGAGALEAPEGGRVVMAACGDEHTLVVTQDGALWACGDGGGGKLGLDNTFSRHVFERVGAGAFGGARVVAAAAGNGHSAAVTEDGALWTWGGGGHGQLGHGDNENQWVPKKITFHFGHSFEMSAEMKNVSLLVLNRKLQQPGFKEIGLAKNITEIAAELKKGEYPGISRLVSGYEPPKTPTSLISPGFYYILENNTYTPIQII